MDSASIFQQCYTLERRISTLVQKQLKNIDNQSPFEWALEQLIVEFWQSSSAKYTKEQLPEEDVQQQQTADRNY